MEREQIREIVNMAVSQTIDELIRRKLIKENNYQYILQVMDRELYSYFNEKNNKRLRSALYQYSDDPYIDVIYLQYRDRKTIEWIAQAMDKDTSTIKRNKKRLIICIYNLLHNE